MTTPDAAAIAHQLNVLVESWEMATTSREKITAIDELGSWLFGLEYWHDGDRAEFRNLRAIIAALRSISEAAALTEAYEQGKRDVTRDPTPSHAVTPSCPSEQNGRSDVTREAVAEALSVLDCGRGGDSTAADWLADADAAITAYEKTRWRPIAAAEHETKRLTKRAKAGVCPCCQRTFKQLAAHMRQKHPDFAADAARKG